jgi:hypothetical protein
VTGKKVRDTRRTVEKCKMYECVGDQTSKKKIDKQCACNITLKRVRVTVVAMGKVIIKYYECICFIASFSTMYRIVACVCLPVPYFATSSRKRHDFRENVIEHTVVF